ncbi:MAG: hypothetical protein PUC23_03430 [bacterium]|nr:hypothetical protein [bacterium]
MLQTIETKFGIIYIEELYDREEVDRVKIFDSELKYMDYYGIEMLENNALEMNHTLEEEYQILIKCFKECFSITELVGIIMGTDNFKITVNWLEVANCLEIDYYSEKEMILEEISGNEYVNKIGDYYIISEY